MYLVNQGRPSPGRARHAGAGFAAAAPCCGSYPYVGFVYSGYPYGYYNDWVGAPMPVRAVTSISASIIA